MQWAARMPFSQNYRQRSGNHRQRRMNILFLYIVCISARDEKKKLFNQYMHNIVERKIIWAMIKVSVYNKSHCVHAMIQFK